MAEELEEIYIHDLVKDVRYLTKDKKVVSFKKRPFWGKLIMLFQDGERNIVKIEETVK